jgi:hypothetical protein
VSELIYNLTMSKNDGLAISPSDFLSRYFFGVKLTTSDGRTLGHNDIAFFIRAAMEQYEGFLNLKLKKQVIRETLHYSLNDYVAWGYLPTTFPVICIKSLTGFIGQVKQVEWPKEWLSIKKDNLNSLAHRNIYIVPSVGTVEYSSMVYNGIIPNSGWMGSSSIPNYWEVVYVTSFDKIPADILDAIGKLASLNAFIQLGDLILGPGIASTSLGIDGLSQSISSTASSGKSIYSARIDQYLKELETSAPLLKAKYNGMILSSL